MTVALGLNYNAHTDCICLGHISSERETFSEQNDTLKPTSSSEMHLQNHYESMLHLKAAINEQLILCEICEGHISCVPSLKEAKILNILIPHIFV